MKKLRWIKLAIISALFYFQGNAQIEMDLADKSQISKTISLKTSPILKISNLIPSEYEKGNYSIFIDLVEEEVPPLKFSPASSQCSDSLEVIQDWIETIAIANDEMTIKKSKAELEKLMKEFNMKTQKPCFDFLTDLLSNTEHSFKLGFELAKNQTITVTVKRKPSKTGDSTIVWTGVFKTPSESPFLVHYGLTYSPNIINDPDHFFAKEDTGGTYLITKMNDNGSKSWSNLSATVNFSYPFLWKESDFEGAATAGFGINAETRMSGFMGLSLIIRKNILLGTGIIFTQKNYLKGMYSEGDRINDNQDFDALHEPLWGPELYLTIGFRLSGDMNDGSKK